MCMRAMQRRLGLDASISRDAPDLLGSVNNSFGGRIVLLDWSAGEILADVPVSGASGLAIDGETIFSCSWIEHCVHVLRGNERISSISHPWFNHLHTIELTSGNNLLIPSAGSDLLLEISSAGKVLFKWFGPEHGYNAPGSNIQLHFDEGADYRAMRRSTEQRAMHMTCALPVGEDRILATLFHQGELIAIERATGKSCVILKGLTRPHGIHRRPGGFLVSDTLGHRIVLLDDDLKLYAEMPFGSQWLQDTICTSAGTYLALENVHIDQLPEFGLTNRIVEIDSIGRLLRQLTMPPDYRLFTAREIDAHFAGWLAEQWGKTEDFRRWAWN